MFKICKACDIITDKTKKIVSDPSELHSMFKFVSTIEVTENNVLCIACCNILKIAYDFQRKVIQSDERSRERRAGTLSPSDDRTVNPETNALKFADFFAAPFELQTYPFNRNECSSECVQLYKQIVPLIKKKLFDEAETHCQDAITNLQYSISHEPLDLANMMDMLAHVFRYQKDFQKATEVQADALEIRITILGQDNTVVASNLDKLSNSFYRLGNFKKGESMCRRALKIREKVQGKYHLDVAKQLNNLSCFCYTQNKHEEFCLHYKRMIEIYEMKLGFHDPICVKSKLQVAFCYERDEKYKEAELIYKELISMVHEKEFGKIDENNKTVWQVAEESEENRYEPPKYPKDSEFILSRLAEVYKQQGKPEASRIINIALT